jgi:hypothetical protein
MPTQNGQHNCCQWLSSLGVFLQGVGVIVATIAAIWKADTLFENVLKIQQQAGGIQRGVAELEQGVAEVRQGVAALKTVIILPKANNIAQSIPLNPTTQQIEQIVHSIPTSVTSGIYLDPMLKAQMIEGLKNSPSLPQREKVLQEYLKYKLPSDSPKD